MTEHLPADGLPDDATVVMAMEISVGAGYVGEDGQDVVYLNVLDTVGDAYTIVVPSYIALLTAGQMAAVCMNQSKVVGPQRQPSTEKENHD